MLGEKRVRQENLFGPVRRETKISRELTALKKILDFGHFRELVKDKFSADDGRPSIAPETLIAIMFLGYWFNITSDRKLCDECEDRLSFRDFIGLDDEESVPVHSSLTHWRQRLGREPFRQFLCHTVVIAKQNGLTPGKCRVFDSSLVKAQADPTGPATAVLDPARDTNDYLDALGDWQPEERDMHNGSDKSGGGKLSSYSKKKMINGQKMKANSHDPDAKFIKRKNKKPDFYHKTHFELDSKTGLVMNADAGHVGDSEKMIQFLSEEREPVDTVGGDTGYFTSESQIWLKQSNIESFISVRDNAQNRGVVFGLESFAYVAEQDEYICPCGVKLTRQDKGLGSEKRYASPRGSCVGCEFSLYCFQSGVSGNRRQLGLSSDHSLVEEAKRRNKCHRYSRIMIKRSIICEGSIGTMKSYGGLGRARALGEEAAGIQSAMAGSVNNMKKIVKHIGVKGMTSLSVTLGQTAYFLRRLGRAALTMAQSTLNTEISRASAQN